MMGDEMSLEIILSKTAVFKDGFISFNLLFLISN
jgi:hypothetical protein